MLGLGRGESFTLLCSHSLLHLSNEIHLVDLLLLKSTNGANNLLTTTQVENVQIRSQLVLNVLNHTADVAEMVLITGIRQYILTLAESRLRMEKYLLRELTALGGDTDVVVFYIEGEDNGSSQFIGSLIELSLAWFAFEDVDGVP